ncbi:VOC family protein [Sphingomonas profundi]|uniref:VOC family protein n=1 Tax=Alterirhizorhabdus profundi TaxID=2681549 RepID=UPI0012E8F0F8|nr:VOC family protein [Sphingomonas profundi]
MRRVIFQEAYFVNSVEEASAKWARDFGAGPFFVVRNQGTEEFSYRGTPIEAEVNYAFGYLGEMMIQFIDQNNDTPSIYRDMFARGQEGFHHIAYLVSDFAAERQRLLDAGYDLATELKVDGVNAAYFDTRETNHIFTEIHGDPPHMLGLFWNWRRLHERRQPGDPAFMDVLEMPTYQVAPMMAADKTFSNGEAPKKTLRYSLW